MSDTAQSSFVYVTYIRTTPEKLWAALTDPAVIRSFWFNMTVESDFATGSPWNLKFEDGRLADTGTIESADPPRRLAIRWRNAWKPEMTDEGWSLCTMDLEPADGAVKLTVTHGIDRPASRFIEAVSTGWPRILSNLKSLLETGAVAIAAAPARH